MEKADFLRPDNVVNVVIWGPENKRLNEISGSGYHRIEEAIQYAVAKANLNINPEDCVFEVSNKSTGITHRYRLNAHGNLKLIL